MDKLMNAVSTNTDGTYTFQWGEYAIRVKVIDSKPWFVAADVCAALEIGNPSQAMTRLDEDEKSTLISNEGVTKGRSMNIVNEYGLYTLILSSRKPEAKAFKRWITHEVLPAINKHGMYLTPKIGELLTTDRHAFLEVVQRYVESEDKREEAERQLALAAPKVKKYDQFMTADGCLVKEFAATLCKNGVTHILLNGKLVTTGQNHLFASLREHKFLCSARGERYNLPMQKWIDAGYFTVKTNSVEMCGSQRQTTTTIITPKGQTYLLDFYKNLME